MAPAPSGADALTGARSAALVPTGVILEDLASKSLQELRAVWTQLSGAPAPSALRRDTLVKLIAYERQARHEGDLSPRIRRELRTLALGQGGEVGPKLSAATAYKPGARLIRTWRGALHEVTVREDGYEWRGEVYRSLSRIAREITGTRWNGLTFFGARRAAKAPTNRHDHG